MRTLGLLSLALCLLVPWISEAGGRGARCGPWACEATDTTTVARSGPSSYSLHENFLLRDTLVAYFGFDIDSAGDVCNDWPHKTDDNSLDIEVGTVVIAASTVPGALGATDLMVDFPNDAQHECYIASPAVNYQLTELTVVGWTLSDTTGGMQANVFDFRYSPDGYNMILNTSTTSGYGQWGISDGTVTVWENGTANLDTREWHHYAGRYSDESTKDYTKWWVEPFVDGTQSCIVPCAIATADIGYRPAGWHPSLGAQSAGKHIEQDNVAVFSEILMATKICSIAKYGLSGRHHRPDITC